MPRPAVTFSRNGTTSSGLSGPPKETSSRASYGATSGPSTSASLGGARGVAAPTVEPRCSRRTARCSPGPAPCRFSAAGLVGRLPLSMAGLGMLLLVQADTGSYGRGRLGLGGLHGRQRDRRPPPGPPRRRAGPGPGAGARQHRLRVGHGRARRHRAGRLAALVDVRRRGRGRRHPPADRRLRPHPLGPRARPAAPRSRPPTRFEAVVDESVFIVGPILVTLLATLVDPVAGIAATVVAGVGGSLAFAAQRGTEPPAHPHDRTARGPACRCPGAPWGR